MSADRRPDQTPTAGVRTRTAEIVVAAVIFSLGVLVVYDSRRIGAGWASDGPEAGYFPFYVGLLIGLSSSWILLQALVHSAARGVFVTRAQLKPVLAVLVPSVVFVAAIYYVGIYVAAGLFIAVFMRWQGRFSFLKIAPVALGVPVILFFMFEVWFLVPLPKGPVEALFGY